MLILDGMPGAGKTTLLGTLLTQWQAVVFPEARPPAEGGDETVLRHLLAEDHARTTEAARLHTHTPERVIASDRCHLGVLAYRYALARLTGQWHDFDRALAHSHELALDQRHHNDTVLILHLEPDESRHRRRDRADDPRYRLWYDQAFLEAYGEFFRELPRWISPGPSWQHHQVTDTDLTATAATLLPAPTAPLAVSNADLACGRDCGQPRSTSVTSPHGRTQLFSRALHHQPRGGPVRCLTSATEITDHAEGNLDGGRHRDRTHPPGDLGQRP
ncbi:hypothetical protein SAMN04487905_12035 [Actinopolyspora xinjiangensis]|uniref:Thymidylate kinase n=1 Tax=Actinopolyspora xinjiangensis TaxID=405564 RepID=A0A1H0X0F5_9ACTN|nr:hypothetical protein [Actinopolyspora xinjiangensis]SDP96448.1 hypothetical protein SAMN04487905_12035 [Actinopolyspora xinjiangensis]